MNKKKYKLAIVISHPIQYQTPLYKELAKNEEIDLKVFFLSNFGLKNYHDKGFGKNISWDIPLLDGYDYEFIKNISPFKNLSSFFGLINPDVLLKLKKEKFQYVWVHGWYNFTNWLIFLLSSFSGVKILLRTEANLFPRKPKIKEFFKSVILKILFKNISAFLSIGSNNTDFYLNYGVKKEKIFHVPYTVNNDFFISKYNDLKDKKTELKRKYNLPNDFPIILFSGKLIGVKCPFDLLYVYEKIVSDIECSLVFLGDGCLRNDLEEYSKKKSLKNVFFLGFRNQTELPEIYALADIFVLPSVFEPWGLVVNEAMCFNLPIIVSDKVGASRDLVENKVNGHIFKAGDINELSISLKEILQDKDVLKYMGEKSKEKILKWSYAEDVFGVLKSLSTVSNINENL